MARARTFRELIALLTRAEEALKRHGISDPGHRVLMLRGIYYGAPWSRDYSAERSIIRNIGFTLFTGFQTPPDPRPALGESLFRDLQNSQDIRERGKAIDVGHVLIGLDARRSLVARNFEIPTQGGTGLEIVTWLGDLGGGAANLAWRRAQNPRISVSVIFPRGGSDYGASINLEGDVGAYVIGSSHGTLDEPTFGRNIEVADLFERYLPIRRTNSGWLRRCRDFLKMLGGSLTGNTLNNRRTLVNQLSHKIETFGVAYMTQRFVIGRQNTGQRVETACQHLHGAAREVAGVFVRALIRTMIQPNLGISGTPPWPRPTRLGSCNHSALQAAASAPDYAKTIEDELERARRDAERFLRELIR